MHMSAILCQLDYCFCHITDYLPLTKTSKKLLEVFEMWMWRRMPEIDLMEMTNKDVDTCQGN